MEHISKNLIHFTNIYYNVAIKINPANIEYYKNRAQIKYYIDDVEYDSMAKTCYERAKAKKDYCMDLIEFFKEVRDNLWNYFY